MGSGQICDGERPDGRGILGRPPTRVTTALDGSQCQQAIAGGGRGDDTLSEETILTNTRPAISSSNQEPPGNGVASSAGGSRWSNPIGGAASGIRPEVWVVCVAA
jgi:hypothetical protein